MDEAREMDEAEWKLEARGVRKILFSKSGRGRVRWKKGVGGGEGGR